MRERIEAALLSQHLLLIVDEADYIWPQAVRVREIPARICWLLTSLINNGVPVALIGSRNFNRLMVNCERRCPLWAGEQFRGRLRHQAALPAQLAESDLFAIARVCVPDADEATRMLLVGHALKSPVPVPAIEACVARARYFANEGARALSFDHFRRAMQEAGTFPAHFGAKCTDEQPAETRGLRNIHATRITTAPPRAGRSTGMPIRNDRRAPVAPITRTLREPIAPPQIFRPEKRTEVLCSPAQPHHEPSAPD